MTSTIPSPEPEQNVPSVLLGRTEPRIFTPPLRELTRSTTYGFEVIDFARDVLEMPLDPWQEFLVIHAGELLEDGRPRFRQVLVLVSRQQGKTTLLTVLQLFWAFVDNQPLTLGTSTNLGNAKGVFLDVCQIAQDNYWLNREIDRIRNAAGEEALETTFGTRVKIAASNRKGGRGLRIDRLVLDELREHTDWQAWNAAYPAMSARPFGQAWMLSNQGDDTSVVLDAKRGSATRYIETGEGDYRLGLFEWSAPDGCDPLDPEAMAYANPNLGRRTHLDDLMGAALQAVANGGSELSGYKTENLCMRVHMLDPAIDPSHWLKCGTESPLQLSAHRDNLVLCIDVSLAGDHATLVAAAKIDGKVHLEVIGKWEGAGCLKVVRMELPSIVAKVKPRAFVWFPSGPAAVLAAELADRKQRRTTESWPPKGVEVLPIVGEIAAVAMGFAEQVEAGDIVHPHDPVLDKSVERSQRLWRAGTWVFGRTGETPVDATYAAAGATHAVRTLPPPRPRIMGA